MYLKVKTPTERFDANGTSLGLFKISLEILPWQVQPKNRIIQVDYIYVEEDEEGNIARKPDTNYVKAEQVDTLGITVSSLVPKDLGTFDLMVRQMFEGSRLLIPMRYKGVEPKNIELILEEGDAGYVEPKETSK